MLIPAVIPARDERCKQQSTRRRERKMPEEYFLYGIGLTSNDCFELCSQENAAVLKLLAEAGCTMQEAGAYMKLNHGRTNAIVLGRKDPERDERRARKR